MVIVQQPLDLEPLLDICLQAHMSPRGINFLAAEGVI